MVLPGMPGNKKGGWSSFGKLITGNSVRQVNLQADFPRADSYILQFNKRNNPASNLPIRAEAFIQWSVEGNWVSRRISVGNGVALVAAAEACKVIISDVTNNLLDGVVPVIPNGTEYEVSVQITPGSRGANSLPPILTTLQGLARHIGDAPLPALLAVPIPEDAGVNSVLVVAHNIGGDVIPSNGLIIEQDAVAPPQILSTYEYGFQNAQFVPIVPGTEQIGVTFNTAVFANPAELIVTVYFGVEG